jgi:uncharacterized membrane protein
MKYAFYAAVLAVVFFSILGLVKDPEVAQVTTSHMTQGRSYAH